MTNDFFGNDSTDGGDVTWEDILEVERALGTLIRKKDGDVDSPETVAKRLSEELEQAQSKIGELEKSNSSLKMARDKSEALVADIKNSGDGSEVGSADFVERQTQLKEREQRLKEHEAKIGKQKAEAEIMFSDLEARQLEIEENGHSPSEAEAAEIQKALDSAQLEWNETRLDLEAQITDLNREVERAKANSNVSQELKEELRSLQQLLQQTNEEVAEKDFIRDQRAKEIENLKAPTSK